MGAYSAPPGSARRRALKGSDSASNQHSSSWTTDPGLQPDRLLRDIGGLGNALLDRVKESGFYFLIPPGSNIASNPKYVRCRFTRDILVAAYNLRRSPV
jgi:hypothetical protein